MLYMLMFLENQDAWAKLSNDEKNRIHAECGAWHQTLVAGRHDRIAQALQRPATARTVRQQDGEAVVTDGPFAETKEVLGGFEIVECRDLDQALHFAKTFPALRAGFAVEVRPVMTGPCEEK